MGVSSKVRQKEKWVRNQGVVGWLAKFTEVASKRG